MFHPQQRQQDGVTVFNAGPSQMENIGENTNMKLYFIENWRNGKKFTYI